MCLKKYCDCFQAGLVCLAECKCVTCKNFEGSDVRARVLAGEEVEGVKHRRTSHRLSLADDDDDDEDDDNNGGDDDDDEVLVTERRTSRRVSAIQGSALAPPAPPPPPLPLAVPDSQPNVSSRAPSARQSLDPAQTPHNPLSHLGRRPSPMPIRHANPHGTSRSYQNQTVRMELCHHIDTSIAPFCLVLLAGIDDTRKQHELQHAQSGGGINVKPAVKAEAGSLDLRTQETMEQNVEAMQERLVLDETLSFLQGVLDAAKRATKHGEIAAGRY